MATAAAIRALGEGGNAVDAAVTATFVLCVVEPQSTGIGGDCFALISKRASRPFGYNGSGRSPAALRAANFWTGPSDRLSDTDVHTVTVPGLVEGLARILADHGTFNLERALGAAIDYAANGFPVHQKVAHEWSGAAWKLQKDEDARRQYLPGKRAPRTGELFRSPELAATLQAIASDGPQEFYAGRTAASMVGSLRRRGSLLRLTDFSKHRGAYVEPLGSRYRGLTVWQIPPNGQGATALLILALLEQLGFGDTEPGSAEYHDLLAHAARLAFRERDTFLGDPEHGEIDLSPFLDKPHAASLARSVVKRSAAASRAQAAALGDTAYVSVVDGERNCVSLISSLFENFGCGLTDAATGVVFHCRGAGFRLTKGHPNSIGPSKRPLHTIIPGMVSERERVVLSFGVTGGHFQPIGQSTIISGMHDRGLDIQAAIDQPRSFFRDGTVLIEPPLGELTHSLVARGHAVALADMAIGGAHGISIDWETGVLTAGSDHRKDGLAIAI